jgi:UPF0716 protein FxsA
MPLGLLVLIFLIVPLLELYVIWQVGNAIGIIPTLLILVADSLLGAYLLRSQGRAVWRRFQRAFEERRMPHQEIVDGVLVIFGGAFLITPGFLTDVFGLLLLLPPTRAIFRRAVMRRLRLRAVEGAAGAARARRPARPAPDGYDVEGSATEYEAPTPRLDP